MDPKHLIEKPNTIIFFYMDGSEFIRIGRLNVQKSFYEKDLRMLNLELDSLYGQAEVISKKEDDLQVKVVGQYGNGKLDFESGIFTKE